MDIEEYKAFSDETIELIEELLADRDRWKHAAEDNHQGMAGQEAIIDRQNIVLDKVRGLKADDGMIRVFDLNVALNCTVCGDNRENHK